MTTEKQCTKNETIVPLIKVCRKINKCDSKQLFSFFGDLSTLLDGKHLSHILSKILTSGFSKCHNEISPNLFEEIISLLPDEDTLNINDSISHNTIEKQDEDVELFSLILIPKDLMIHISNFLTYIELIEIEKSCRWLCTVSRDSNCLNNLYLKVTSNTINNWYDHPRFAKISTLKMYIISNKFKLIQNYHKWSKNIISFTLTINVQTTCVQLPDFINLQHCSLSRFGSHLLTENKIKHHKLKCLALNRCTLDELLFTSIIKCVNLERLSIFIRSVNETFDDNPIFDDITLNPLSKLKYFEMNINSARNIPNFFHWILSSNQKEKIISFHQRPKFRHAFSTLEITELFSQSSKLGFSPLEYITHIDFIQPSDYKQNSLNNLEQISKCVTLFNSMSNKKQITISTNCICLSMNNCSETWQTESKYQLETLFSILLNYSKCLNPFEIYLKFSIDISFDDGALNTWMLKAILNQRNWKSCNKLIIEYIIDCDEDYSSQEEIELLILQYHKYFGKWTEMSENVIKNINMNCLQIRISAHGIITNTRCDSWETSVIPQIHRIVLENPLRNLEIARNRYNITSILLTVTV